MTRIVKKSESSGRVKYIIQDKYLWWWITRQTFSASWHGEGGYEDLDFDTYEEVERYLTPTKYEVCKNLF
jgi:hypothetical protein